MLAERSAPPVTGPADTLPARTGRRGRRVLLIQAITVIVVLAIWQAMSAVGFGVREFFPSLSAIAGALWRLLTDGELGPHLAVSAYEIGFGFVLGAIPGLIFGLIASLNGYVRRVFEPLILYFAAVPYIIVFPIFILAFTVGPNSKVAMAAASAFFPMAINTITASASIRPVHLKLGQTLRLSTRQMLAHIYLPSMAPGILVGVRMSLGVAIVGALLAETKAARGGLGFLVFGAYRNLDIARMYALLVLIFVLAAVINWLMTLLAARSTSTRTRSNVSGFFA